MKRLRLAIFGMLLSLALVLPGWAADWGIVANGANGTISMVEFKNGADPKVHGPFLAGEMGSGAEVLDIAVTPDGDIALISSYQNSTVYFMDIGNPFEPSILGSIEISVFPEDIALTSDGRYAMVADGASNNKVALLDVQARTLLAEYELQTGNGTAGAHAVAIAPDNETVIICDYFSKLVIFGRLDTSTGLTGEASLPAPGWPVNVTVAPDGQTVLVANYEDDTVGVFRITEPGVIVPGVTPSVSGLPGGQQSIIFSKTGTRAYVLSTSSSPDSLSSLIVQGPGQVILETSEVVSVFSDASGAYFGVDAMALLNDGRILVGNPSTSGSVTKLALVSPDTWTVTGIETGIEYPAGVAVKCGPACRYVIPYLSTNIQNGWNGCGVSNILNAKTN
ncbi:MAG: hypothetical protein EOM25_11620, partial [Deltaproteobacteria bacterium]|nr:hypothetical protein [Deltaproteobacteria bacterium]